LPGKALAGSFSNSVFHRYSIWGWIPKVRATSLGLRPSSVQRRSAWSINSRSYFLRFLFPFSMDFLLDAIIIFSFLRVHRFGGRSPRTRAPARTQNCYRKFTKNLGKSVYFPIYFWTCQPGAALLLPDGRA